MLMKFQKQPHGEEEADQVCTNYRFARRKAMRAQKAKEGDKSHADGEQGESRNRKRVVAPKKVVGKGKKGAKEENAGPSQEELDAEAAIKEEEDKIKAKEEAIKNQKPKDYDDEEMAKYNEFATDFE